MTQWHKHFCSCLTKQHLLAQILKRVCKSCTKLREAGFIHFPIHTILVRSLIQPFIQNLLM